MTKPSCGSRCTSPSRCDGSCALPLLDARCPRCALPALLAWLLPALASRDCSREKEPRAQSTDAAQHTSTAGTTSTCSSPRGAQGSWLEACALGRWDVGYGRSTETDFN
jgi:hypothetical protein